MEISLEGLVFWHLMPVQLLGPDNLPIYSGTTQAERFDVEVVRYQALVLSHYEPIMTTALRTLVNRFGIPDKPA